VAEHKQTGSFTISVLSLLVALVSVLSTGVLQWNAQRTEVQLRSFEATFLAKQKAYSEMVASVDACLEAGRNPADLVDIWDVCVYPAQTRFAAVEPFLSNDEVRDRLYEWVDDLTMAAFDLQGSWTPPGGDRPPEDLIEEFWNLRQTLRRELYASLFSQSVDTTFLEHPNP
jgi:hypothetical protein